MILTLQTSLKTKRNWYFQRSFKMIRSAGFAPNSSKSLSSSGTSFFQMKLKHSWTITKRNTAKHWRKTMFSAWWRTLSQWSRQWRWILSSQYNPLNLSSHVQAKRNSLIAAALKLVKSSLKSLFRVKMKPPLIRSKSSQGR